MALTKNETRKAADGQTPNAASGDSVKKIRSSEKKQESVYSVDEFCNSAQAVFHTRPECVRAALAEKNITQCSRTEAKKVVEAFIKKEVK